MEVKMTIAIAFVPASSVDGVLDQLANETDGVSADLQPILNWFQNNYVSRHNTNRSRREPIFPVQM